MLNRQITARIPHPALRATFPPGEGMGAVHHLGRSTGGGKQQIPFPLTN